jgi:hypothetical protein
VPYRRGAVRKDNGGRSTAVYRRYRAQVLADPMETRCIICGGWVDKTIPYRDPFTGKVNLMSPSLEHTKALIEGGGLLQSGRMSHLGCNLKSGARLGHKARAEAARLRDPSMHF